MINAKLSLSKVLSAARDNELVVGSTKNERRELALAFDSLTFQYRHLHVLLTRQNELDQESCLHSARDAMKILPNLVSTSEEVYNGIVW